MNPPNLRLGVSGTALILANLIPMFGVIWWGWDVFGVVALYWLENVIIGFVNVLKMLTCSPDGHQAALKRWAEGTRFGKKLEWIHDEETGEPVKIRVNGAEGKEFDLGSVGIWNHASKLFLVPFFMIHYGMFCAVHGVFVFILLGGSAEGGMGSGGFPSILDMASALFQGDYKWGVLGLAASHLVSFLYNWVYKGEYRRMATPLLMISPYGRIIVLHLAILLGAFVTMALGSGAAILTVLIVGKIILDLIFHQREHRKMAA